MALEGTAAGVSAANKWPGMLSGARVGLRSGAASADDNLVPLAADLASLFPGGGLRRGSTVVVERGSLPGAMSTCLALLSGPSAAGSWCAVVGMPEIGLVAAAGAGIALERLCLVPGPGSRWAPVTAAALDGFDLVLLGLRRGAGRSEARSLEAHARERGSVLVVLGDGWPVTPDVRVAVASRRWYGMAAGHGHLAGCETDIVVGGRRAASRPRHGRLRSGEVVVPLPSPPGAAACGRGAAARAAGAR